MPLAFLMRIIPSVKAALKKGGVGVLPTDTIYGLVGSALNKRAVERIYKLRRRNPRKPMIILISDMRQAIWNKFGIVPDKKTTKILKKVWPGRVSIVLPIRHSPYAIRKFKYLHRGTKTLAFRLPKPYWLRRLLASVGPLVAPSANPEGLLPAKTIEEAKRYFGDKVDFYVDAGRMMGRPSRLIKIADGKIKVLRK